MGHVEGLREPGDVLEAEESRNDDLNNDVESKGGRAVNGGAEQPVGLAESQAAEDVLVVGEDELGRALWV